MIEYNEIDLLFSELVSELSKWHDSADNTDIIDAFIQFDCASKEEMEYEEIHGNVGDSLSKLTEASDSEVSFSTKVDIF